MKNFIVLFFAISVVFLQSCGNSDSLKLPSNKVWAHRVNTIAELQEKENLFEGLETDLLYSFHQNKIFVCHDVEDTIDGLTFGEWLGTLQSPQKHGYWLDIKDLNQYNCDTVVSLIKLELKKYNVEHRAFIENSSPSVLKRIKELGMHTSLWVTNLCWTKIDTTDWISEVQMFCDSCQPDALSCEWRMYGALTTFFPDKNIFLWHTPASCSPENMEITRSLCRNKSVKIVLVDYDEPCGY